MEKKVFNAAYRIISGSNFVKTSLIEDYRINEDKIVVIPLKYAPIQFYVPITQLRMFARHLLGRA